MSYNNFDKNDYDLGLTARLKSYGPFKAKDGMILGVAKGLADHYGWSPTKVRLIMVAMALLLFFWPMVILYIAAAFIMSPAPQTPLENKHDRDFWLGVNMNTVGMMSALETRSRNVEKRLRRLEDYVTSKDYVWDELSNSR